ncbi:relaxin-3 [Molossus nigricans]
MAKHPLLLLLSVWVMAGALWLETEARDVSEDRVKICGWKIIRAIIFTCGSSRWRRLNILAREAMGDAFPDAEPDADSKLEEAVASSEWLALTKSPQAFYRSKRSWQGTLEALQAPRDIVIELASNCCTLGCSESEISRLC